MAAPPGPSLLVAAPHMLVFELHNAALRLLSGTAHHAGLQIAAKHHWKAGTITAQMYRRLCRLDTAYHITRHITPALVAAMQLQLQAATQQDTTGPMHGGLAGPDVPEGIVAACLAQTPTTAHAAAPEAGQATYAEPQMVQSEVIAGTEPCEFVTYAHPQDTYVRPRITTRSVSSTWMASRKRTKVDISLQIGIPTQVPKQMNECIPEVVHAMAFMAGAPPVLSQGWRAPSKDTSCAKPWGPYLHRG